MQDQGIFKSGLIIYCSFRIRRVSWHSLRSLEILRGKRSKGPTIPANFQGLLIDVTKIVHFLFFLTSLRRPETDLNACYLAA